MSMTIATRDKGEKLAQKAILAREYVDYDPRHHDAFVHRYNLDCEKRATVEYMLNRGIINTEEKDKILFPCY